MPEGVEEVGVIVVGGGGGGASGTELDITGVNVEYAQGGDGGPGGSYGDRTNL